jgi:hypothetical protein
MILCSFKLDASTDNNSTVTISAGLGVHRIIGGNIAIEKESKEEDSNDNTPKPYL